MSKVYDLVAVGAGPAGIGAAYEGIQSGFKDVLLLEKMGESSHTIRNYYKKGKRVDKLYKGIDLELKGHIPFTDSTREPTLDYFEEFINTTGIEYKVWSEVSKITKDKDIFTVYSNSGEYQCKNVVIGIGNMGKPNKPSYKIPGSIKKQVNFNLDKVVNGEAILVVGGGDSAVEYAFDLAFRKLDVTLNYRKTEFTRINDINKKDLNSVLDDGTLKTVLGIDVDSIEDADDNKIKVNFNNGSSQLFDRIIYAIGGTTPVDFLKSCGIEVDDKKVPFQNENHQTNVEGLYVAGDIACKGGGSVCLALNHSYEAIIDIVSTN
ncbi:MAG: Thioredoxin reductase (EC [uncultured Campylobacterales bacterium]|uniref:Thioredoxin reductase (EC) n=1 Tax=uncultured Campylobacterales bacterium TaxID=352960 RepID=A0A6S6SRT7_9BACT|nr:MAG: Thioredoxin reductase (EC [uncultured Campylobacterales bacterium]